VSALAVCALTTFACASTEWYPSQHLVMYVSKDVSSVSLSAAFDNFQLPVSGLTTGTFKVAQSCAQRAWHAPPPCDSVCLSSTLFWICCRCGEK
jgi:hypothetical protein